MLCERLVVPRQKILHRFIDCLNVLAVGKMITSRSPGTAFEFALTIVEQLVGTENKESLIDQMLLKMWVLFVDCMLSDCHVIGRGSNREIIHSKCNANECKRKSLHIYYYCSCTRIVQEHKNPRCGKGEKWVDVPTHCRCSFSLQFI